MNSVHSKRLLAFGFLGVSMMLPSNLVAQSSGGSITSPGADSSGKPHLQNGWVVRDPTTGRMYHQQLVQVNVPTVRWENKSVTTTVVQPQWVTRVVPQTQTAYQATTQMVLQPYWQGRWNPFRQPVLAYRHVPHTTWKPTSMTTNQVVTTQQLVPTQQTIQVPQPITGSQTVQQLVQTEIPQVTQPLLGSFPLLAGRPAWQSPGWQNSNWQGSVFQPSRPQYAVPSSTWIANTSQRAANMSGNGLRSVERAVQNVMPPTYQAPLQTASRPSGSWDDMQSGLRPTVLR